MQSQEVLKFQLRGSREIDKEGEILLCADVCILQPEKIAPKKEEMPKIITTEIKETNSEDEMSYLEVSIDPISEKVFYRSKECAFQRTSDEFKLLEILVEAKGQPLSVHDIYQRLDYKNKRKVYGYNSPKKSAPSANKVKNDRLRSTIKRLLKKLGAHHLKIEAAEKTGVFLKKVD